MQSKPGQESRIPNQQLDTQQKYTRRATLLFLHKNDLFNKSIQNISKML